MAKYYVRGNSGQWVDCCSTPVHVRDSSGNWRRLGNGTKVYANGAWHNITCALPSTTIRATMTYINFGSSATYTVRYIEQGSNRMITLTWGTPTQDINADQGTDIIVAWSNSNIEMHIDNQLRTISPQTIRVGNTSIKIDGYEVSGDGGGETQV